MANRQYLIPGDGYINETTTSQFLIPGTNYVNTTSSIPGAALAATVTCVCTVISDLTTQISFVSSLTSICTVSASFGDMVATLACRCLLQATFGANLSASLVSFSTVSINGSKFFIGSAGISTAPIAFPPLPHVTELEKLFPKIEGQDTNRNRNVVWLDWLARLSNKTRLPGQLDWTQLTFRNSNLTDLATRNHNDLQNIQGGAAGDEYHVTLVEHDKINVDEILLWLSF
jgi:hypothetical protein